jgi:outer membrane protein assembly factor BamE (lipoprotein component of BamABCDE complex)
MRCDWNLQQCWGFAAVLACTLGVAACGHNAPNDAKSKQPPSAAPNFPAVAKVDAGNGPAVPWVAGTTHTIAREAVDKVKIGMHETEVKQLLGAPSMESSLGGSSVMMTWYDPDKQYVQIIFDKGQVTQKTYGGQKPAADAFSQAKLDQVKTGMTLAAVRDLLGPSQGDVNAGPTRVLSWETSKVLVTIIFRNGKVESKFATPK